MSKLCGAKSKYWSSPMYLDKKKFPPYKPYGNPCKLFCGHSGQHNNGSLIWHQTEMVILPNKVLFEIDRGMVDIVRLLNSIKDLETDSCCESSKEAKGQKRLAYVTISGPRSNRFFKETIAVYSSLFINVFTKRKLCGFYWRPKNTPLVLKCFAATKEKLDKRTKIC